MLELNYNTDLDKDETFQGLLQATEDYTHRLRDIAASGAYDEYESSICLPSDDDLLERVDTLADRKAGANLRYHIVVGIGGSNLGTKAVYEAIHSQSEVLTPEQFPKLLFAETTDPTWLKLLHRLLQDVTSPDHLLISIISKSGGTTETLANFEIIMGMLREQFASDCTERVTAITDEGSDLWEQARAGGIDCLAIPSPVGGRYSVLSAVGLFPLRTIGVDVAALRQGAAEMRDACLEPDSWNPAARSATVLAYHCGEGKTINDNFFFHPELESTGKWYRQLMGESIGKAESLEGKPLNTGITPTVSLGSTDLHSVGQLYLGGPKDKLTTFVYARSTTDLDIPGDRVFPELNPTIAGSSARQILDAILEGVKVAYRQADLPYMEVTMERVDAAAMGAYLQFKMLEMMYLGVLLNVNSFTQPNVESYKTETKRILEG